eukprot:3316230-Lingulodinium_polyedra.AAC.1
MSGKGKDGKPIRVSLIRVMEETRKDKHGYSMVEKHRVGASSSHDQFSEALQNFGSAITHNDEQGEI